MAVSVVKTICKAMESIAPLRLAEKWDNVGLLLESPIVRPNANRVLLTIDITTAVAEEALSTPTACIVSYHPTIFKPLSSLTLANPLQSSLLRCATAGVSVYCPHTALDSVWGGINDWLSSGVGKAPEDTSTSPPFKVALIGDAAPDERGGQGRIVTLPEAVSMKEIERRIKYHLGLKHIQVGYPEGKSPGEPTVQTIAVCAGSGDEILLGVDADVYFTGEMPHHAVLASVASGHWVALCGHTNTERGYLAVLQKNLEAQLKTEAMEADGSTSSVSSVLRSLEVHISKKDKHPLQIV